MSQSAFRQKERAREEGRKRAACNHRTNDIDDDALIKKQKKNKILILADR